MFFKALTSDLVIQLLSSALSLPPLAYSLLVKKLVAERQFWVHSVMVKLVQYGVVTGRYNIESHTPLECVCDVLCYV